MGKMLSDCETAETWHFLMTFNRYLLAGAESAIQPGGIRESDNMQECGGSW